MAASVLDKLGPVPVRRGHFLLESGLHTDAWLELDSLFLDPADLKPRVEALAAMIEPYQVSAICGPLLGGALLAQAVATRLGLRFYVAERVPSETQAGLFQAQYRLPPSQQRSAPKESFAILDDAIGAGSSVRATFAELTRLGAETRVIGALFVQGDRAAVHFAQFGLPVIACAALDIAMWEPSACPHCRAGLALDPAP